jgi:hypothetical protein
MPPDPVELLIGVTLQTDGQRDQDDNRRGTDHHSNGCKRHARFAAAEVPKNKSDKIKNFHRT